MLYGEIKTVLKRIYRLIFGNVKALNRYLRIMFIRPELIKLTNKVILDIGCGDGHFTQYLLGNGNKVFTLDINNRMVSLADLRKRFAQADAKVLPYRNASFDFVFCSDVFEHIPEYERIVPEISRVLRLGGKYLISTVEGLWKSPLGIRNVLLRFPKPFRDALLGEFNQPDLALHKNFMGHINFNITKSDLIDLLKKNGLRIIKEKTYCHKVGSLLMEIYFSLNESIRYFTFPVLRPLLWLDKFGSNRYYWQFYLIGQKGD